MVHWPLAAHFVEQTATLLAETTVHFLGKADGIGTTRLYKIGEERLGR